MSRADYGIVEVEIDGETYELKPTLAALRKISRKFAVPGDTTRGLRPAIESCSSLDPDQMAEIIAIGANIDSGSEKKKLPEAVFATGIINVLPQVTEYLMLLLNPTGKDAEEDVDEPGE